MVGLRKHIYWLYFFYGIFFRQQCKILPVLQYYSLHTQLPEQLSPTVLRLRACLPVADRLITSGLTCWQNHRYKSITSPKIQHGLYCLSSIFGIFNPFGNGFYPNNFLSQLIQKYQCCQYHNTVVYNFDMLVVKIFRDSI